MINLYRVNHNIVHCGQCYIHGFGSVSCRLSSWRISRSSGDVSFFVFNVDQWQLFFHYYFRSGVICKIGCDESKILFCCKYFLLSIISDCLYVYLSKLLFELRCLCVLPSVFLQNYFFRPKWIKFANSVNRHLEF